MEEQYSSLKTDDGNERKDGQLLSWDEINPIYREPFILSGYRRPGSCWSHCLQQAFTLHNDVINFWTHFIPFLLYVVWFIAIAVSSEDFFQAYHYPLFCFWAGACSYTLFSSLAHLFACKSFLVRTVCFMLDYLGIAMYALGADISSLFYLSSASSTIYHYKEIILSVEVIISVLATLLCSLTRFYWRDYRFLIRALSFVLPYSFAIGPYLHRGCGCWLYSTDCLPDTVYLYIYCLTFTSLLFFFFVTKIPERFFPGSFDMFFHSHQIFHLCAVALTSAQMYYLPMEVMLRKEVLMEIEEATSTWQTTLLPFACAELLGLGVICVLGFLTKTGFLTSNKFSNRKKAN